MQRAINIEVTQPPSVSVENAHYAGEFLGEKSKAHRQSLVVAFLVLTDILLALSVWGTAAVIQSIWGQGSLSEASLTTIITNIVVWVGLRWLLGLYPGYGLAQTEELRRQTSAVLATLAITAIFALTLQVGDLISRLLLILGFLGLALTAPLVRYLVKSAMKRSGLWGKPVVILSFGESGGRLVKLLKKEWGLGFRPVAIFDSRLAPVDGMLEGVPYGGSVSEAMEFSCKGQIGTAIFAMPYTRREHLVKFVEKARDNFRHVIVIPNLEGVTNSAVVARDLAGTFGVEIKHNLLDPWTRRTKRALDLCATIVGGILILPLLLTLSLLVWLESRGPVFYSAQRMGRDGKLFSCVKFKTMLPDAEGVLQKLLEENVALREEYSRYHKLRDDPRVTRVGRFLRKTSLDELPQLWNILRGDMSLVGPRPYLPRESQDIGSTQSNILRVYPGVTGPWQVNGRNHTSFNERVQMDAYYVHNWSIWLDLLLLARTVKCVLFDRGAY